MAVNLKETISNLMGSFNTSSVKPNDEYARKPDPSPWDNPVVVQQLTEPISDWKWRGMVESGQVKFATEAATAQAKSDAVMATMAFKPETPTGGMSAPKTASFKKTP
ncbi:MAG: hypothetical protein PSY14_06025 [bacterium]|nr:hypothetical protein [bacterium]